MTELADHLERLGLEQYLDAFIGEGFDTWETLLDVQESDLESLNVKLGHRRKLQRAIAEFRGISYERLIGSPGLETGAESSRPVDNAQGPASVREGVAAPPVETKRKYRRHPKADDNAPVKPPSAYVLFSNQVREEVKAENLSFSDIAKLVGERWQKLDTTQTEPYRSEAAALKDQYNTDVTAYKKTEFYKEYQQYLAEFKAKHSQNAESKRPKLDPQSSGSHSAASHEAQEVVQGLPSHARGGSVGSISTTSQTGPLPSPAGSTLTTVSSLPNLTTPAIKSIPSIPRTGSPSSVHYGRDRRFLGQLSNQSSMSDDSGQIRSAESMDPVPRAAALSISTPPAMTPPPLHTMGSARSEHSGTSDTFAWMPRGLPAGQHGSLPPPLSSPHGSGLTLPSPTLPTDQWRDRVLDTQRNVISVPLPIPHGGPSSSLNFPGAMPTDRVQDYARSQSHRTLPPLRQSSSGGQSHSTFPFVPHPMGGMSMTRPGQTKETSDKALDRHDNEVATTLAGLSGRSKQGDMPSPGGRRAD